MASMIGIEGDLGAFLIGAVAGTLSGLLGIGGGIVMVPLMVLALGLDQHVAQEISLSVIVPTSLSGALSSARKGNVAWRFAIFLACGALAGSFIGATLSNALPEYVLRKMFAIILVILGYRILPAEVRQRLHGMLKLTAMKRPL
ncbi:MAG: sulfite exporter TauE/SafE family protein [Chloroflexi bacterium]|nr:sulfite exporter TauE/SafE family protein [Chloroflexota bacterium]MCL5946453.1 sulfite exporter TauE/SafE family protein [Chloroflexota bacterium]